MDEEDSQDELINRNTSQKSRRPTSIIWSDNDEDSNDGDDSGEEEIDSDEEDDHKEEEEEEDEEGVSDEGDCDGKELEGAVGGPSTDLAGLSSDEDSEKCPICLNSFHEQPVATPESCEHYFCLDCILEWSKNANSCPVDRIVFKNICLRTCYGGKVQKHIEVEKKVKEGEDEQVDVDLEQTNCEVCGGSDREDRLLLCDGCDAGYHMECLTPPLDAVPVEEWFCPECAANSRNGGGAVGDSNERPSTSRSRSSTSRPTRAIARTQQSERVRASINRHRITQLAPRYMIQSTWLDETINAVVAGMNTAVYMRNLTPRATSRRRRKTVKRRKGKSTSGGKTAGTGVKRRKRKVRRKKSRRKLVVKKESSSRCRIARNLGLGKPARSTSIPSVYRPTEQSLGSMRMDIGAASLSVYGDPFDLDPFEDGEEEEMEETPSSLLDLKRGGLSRSALRSHHPVARPITAGLSRQGQSVAPAEVVAAPVPDLLGSILSGQNLLMMDSANVVINRDGSLKAIKPVNTAFRNSSVSETANTSTSASSPFSSNEDAGPYCTPLSRTSPSHSSTSSHTSPPHTSTSLRLPTPTLQPHSDLQPNGLNCLGPSQGSALGKARNPWVSQRPMSNPSELHNSERQDLAIQQEPAAKKAPLPKPVWVDVATLPRIPKIKREDSAQVEGSRRNGHPGGMNSLAGNQSRQQTVNQQRSNSGQQGVNMGAQRQRSDRAGHSSSFCSSFSSSSSASSSGSVSSTATSASSSSVSFRISSSGNSWHVRRLGTSGAMLSSSKPPKPAQEEVAKRHHKTKQMLLASKSQTEEMPGKSKIYDPFDPTGSDSSDYGSDTDEPAQMNQSHLPSLGSGLGHTDCKKEETELPVKSENTDVKVEENTAVCVKVKEEPENDGHLHHLDERLRNSPKEAEMSGMSMHFHQSPKYIDFENAEGSGTSESVAGQTQCFKSNSTSSRHNDKRKTEAEVKSEPTDEASLDCKPVSSSAYKKQHCNDNDFPKRCHRSNSSSSDHVQRGETEQSSPGSHPRERRRTRSRSSSPCSKQQSQKKKKRSRSRSRDRGRSRSSSEERRRTKKHVRHRGESHDCDRHRRSKTKRHSPSRSRPRSLSRERSREQTWPKSSISSSSSSKEQVEGRSEGKKGERSRSQSKDRRTVSSRFSLSLVNKEPSQKLAQKKTLPDPGKEETKVQEIKYENASIKQESDCIRDSICGIVKMGSQESDNNVDKNRSLPMSKEIKQEKPWSPSAGQSQGAPEFKQENNAPYFCEEHGYKGIKTEGNHTQIEAEIEEHERVKSEEETTSALHLEERSEKVEMLDAIKEIKDEHIMTGQTHHSVSSCSRSNDLVEYSVDPNGAWVTDCSGIATASSSQFTTEAENNVVLDSPQRLYPVKQENDEDLTDEDFNVDSMLDCIDIKNETTKNAEVDAESFVLNAPLVKTELALEKQEVEPTAGVMGSKAKSQVKRVTWNLQESDSLPVEKTSKLALYKMKLKQDGARKAASNILSQSQVGATLSVDAVASTSVTVPGEVSDTSQGTSTAKGEDSSEEPSCKDKYMKKLHMQERAIEEVKLAIKPFYQKRDITKEEYKDILRKAVQKVCHSKSGEINPVKVANLVKAYVDKYKYARKHKKGEECTSSQEAESSKEVNT
ncbi:PHD and RING finger domain-containing protein 1 isoform X2 [Denticeps clupeoides]|uniref:PHD and RING finger domain-containing protein 1 isoform X2 n=1 Tax=Denticeps clupeoides TaxID=299321 RepID=UPI0010A38A70|nr:PHD and RING finger domain-containing protein 1 isoform X2 [Denticeps clupeoides]